MLLHMGRVRVTMTNRFFFVRDVTKRDFVEFSVLCVCIHGVESAERISSDIFLSGCVHEVGTTILKEQAPARNTLAAMGLTCEIFVVHEDTCFMSKHDSAELLESLDCR